MPRKKPDSQPKKPNRSPSVTIYARVRPGLGRAFKEYVKGLRPRTTDSSVLEMILEEYLHKNGVEVLPEDEPTPAE